MANDFKIKNDELVVEIGRLLDGADSRTSTASLASRRRCRDHQIARTQAEQQEPLNIQHGLLNVVLLRASPLDAGAHDR